MVTVKFNDADEFLEELGKNLGKVEQNIVRLTFSFTPSKLTPNIRHLQVLATAQVGRDILRLEHYCGQVWEIGTQDTPVQEEAGRVHKQLEEGCERLGLEVRAGVLEEDKEGGRT